MCLSHSSSAGKSETVSDDSPASLKQTISNLQARINELEPRNRDLEREIKIEKQARRELHDRYEEVKWQFDNLRRQMK